MRKKFRIKIRFQEVCFMTCQSCGQRAATTHIKTVINGQLTETHLCSQCAKKQGYGHMLSEWNGFGSLLGGLLSGGPEAGEKRCPGCGASFRQISRSGKIGCGECYNTFRGELIPVIERVHGAARHRGKVPGGSALRVPEQGGLMAVEEKKPSKIEEKRQELKKAVEAQDFERAAVLRDEIKEMESHE